MSPSEPAQAGERASGAPGLRGGAPHHQPQLDGVRGLAIFAVLLSHAVFLIDVVPNTGAYHKLLEFSVPGWGGVDLFFALSGFLITGILLRGRHGTGYFTSFYARRVLRIFPIYYLILIGSLLLGTQVPYLREELPGSIAHLPATALQRFSYFVYLQNIPYFWSTLAGGLTGLWGAYWSLAVEEQFYLVWPALVRFLKLSWLYWFCIAALVAGPFVRAWVTGYTGEKLGVLQFPITRLDGLFAGAALALYRYRHGRPLSLRWAGVWFGAGAGILLYIAIFHKAELIDPNYYFDRIGISGFALASLGMIAATQHHVAWLEKLLISRPLRVLGKYSYGIYVYHLSVFLLFHRLKRYLLPHFPRHVFPPVLACLYVAVAMLLAVGLAWCSFTWIERPILSLKRFFPSPGGAR